MDKDLLISIVMPVKNAGKYLGDCLDSILSQDYTYWELIAVENNSDDNSWEILESYSKREPRIKAYSHKKNGIIPALKNAYAYTEGDLITRMDADDLMAIDKLSAMAQVLEQQGRGSIAVGLVAYFSDKDVGQGYTSYAEWLNRLSILGANFSDIYKECTIPSPAWMMYRSDFETCGAFDSKLYPEDYDLCFRMYAQNYKVSATKHVVHHWRDYSTRTSRIDPLYEDNRFLDLKLNYFLALDYNADLKLVLWGAGNKGKSIARLLVDHSIPFVWLCNNTKKVGHNIYGQTLEQSDRHPLLAHADQTQIIVALASPKDKEEVLNYLQSKAHKIGVTYFPFS